VTLKLNQFLERLFTMSYVTDYLPLERGSDNQQR
jgi:hypothetical protein